MSCNFYKIKVFFNDIFKEFEYIKSYNDFLKKLHEIFNLNEIIEMKIFYINEDKDKILINNNDEYSKCKYNDDGYYIFKMEIKENIIENKINNVIEEEKEENKNFKPNTIKIKFETEENEFDYTKDFDNFIEECKFHFNISEISLLNLYNTNNNKILVENKEIYNSLIPDKEGCLFFELKFNPKDEKFLTISKVSQRETSDKFDESNINKAISLKKLKLSLSNINNYNNYNYNYLINEIKEKLKKKNEELKNKFNDYLNIKKNEFNNKVNEKFRTLNQLISKQKKIYKISYSNELNNCIINNENNFSLIKPHKNKIPFLKKNLNLHKESLKKCSCEFKQEKYYFKINHPPPINKKITIKVKNNGKNVWPKGCIITLNNNKNQNIKIYGITKREVFINEEIPIQINIIIDINFICNSFKSSFKISFNDYVFSFNNCEIEIYIENNSILKKNCKLIKNKIEWNNNKNQFNHSNSFLKINLSEVKFQLKKYNSYNLQSKKKIIKENKSKSNFKTKIAFQ